MKPGRELDALVAEKVMGVCLHDLQSKPSVYMQMKEKNGPHDWTMFECAKCHSRFMDKFIPYLPNYSTSIADAWAVVEKMGRWNGFEFMIQTQDPEYCKAKYEAGWYEPSYDGPESRAVGESDSAPHAICLAALKAVGVDLENP